MNAQNEEWRPVQGLESRFEVSNFGRVRSLPSRSRPGTIRKLGVSNTGYITLHFHIYPPEGRVSKSRSVHRMVATAFIENPKQKPCVNHIDGNRLNNRADNLEWVTHRENDQHAERLGLRPHLHGERNGAAKLTMQQVVNIRHARGAASQRHLGTLYGITQSAVCLIQTRKNWGSG